MLYVKHNEQTNTREVILIKDWDFNTAMSSRYDPVASKKIRHSDGTRAFGEYVFKSKIKETYERIRTNTNR